MRTRELMRREIISLWEKQEKTIVFVTHDVDEAVFLADRILVFSPKPTRIIETVEIGVPRYRDLEHDPDIQSIRRRLYTLLRDEPSKESVDADYP